MLSPTLHYKGTQLVAQPVSPASDYICVTPDFLIPMRIFDMQYLYSNTPHFTGVGATSRRGTYDVDIPASKQRNNKT